MLANKRIFLAFCICQLLIVIGTAGYVIIENYSWFDALYMTIITVTTVGFGEIKELSVAGRAFTIILILVGFGSLAFVGHSLVESIMEKILQNTSGTKKMLKKISQLRSHYILCGYGRVGESAAQTFNKAGVDFVIIEANPEHCLQIKEQGFLYIEGDATSEEHMLSAGIKTADGLLALLATDPDNLFIVLSARELNPTLRIVSRSTNASSEHKIIQAGADNVISPLKAAGRKIARDILKSEDRSSLMKIKLDQTEPEPQWVQIQEGSSLQDKSIKELQQELARKIIGYRRLGVDHIMPADDLVMKADDSLLILDYAGEPDEKETDPNSQTAQKIVIIDDNPVIGRLYVRLFQRAGYHPITAIDGKEGLDLILSERPAAAIIDYKLPSLSGIEICKEVRRSNLDNIQLILFTADQERKTRERALAAGADEVIVKSANATAIIESVNRHLQDSGNKP